MSRPVPDLVEISSTATAPSRARLGLVLIWLSLTLLVAAHQWSFWHADRLDTDVLALLPQSEQSPEVSLATRQLTDSASRQIMVLVGATDWPAAKQAALRFDRVWRERDGALATGVTASLAAGRKTTDALLPWRDRLLTAAQRERLQQTPPAALAEAALASLHRPGAGLRLSDWLSDPLDLWPRWWSSRLAGTPARPRDGLLALRADGVDWVFLSHDIAGSAFALNGNAVHKDALRAAEAAARTLVPQVRVLTDGVALHAEAAAAQARREVNLIGWGSLTAIVLLMWLAFHSLRSIVLVVATLVVGCATALSVTALVFGKVHLLTLVFGASLVGVAEDFGLHYFASRMGHPRVAPQTLMRGLLPGLLLALGTSVIAYLALGLAPFPGLRQMAVFSATGLSAAFLTVYCWFAVLDRGAVPSSALAIAIANSLACWPRLRPSRWVLALTVLVVVLSAFGVARLRVNDDIRHLQSSPPALMYSQREIQKLLQLPSPAQFLLVNGSTEQQTLEREERLRPLLDRLLAEGTIKGYVALSDWVPSIARQQADAALTARIETQVLTQVGRVLGETLRRPVFTAKPLTLQNWLALPESAALRGLWLADTGRGPHSVVLLQGLSGASQFARLQTAVQGIDGVRWVDKTSEISALMGRYRGSMSLLLPVGYAAVLIALCWRFGRAAWRAWLPTLLASLFTVAALGWLGESFQLFNVLALVLLLGIGVDYGIFLLEHDADGSAWLAVVLGAASTLLSFGLLSLSSTPALRAFGLTMAIGTTCVWLLSPMLRSSTSPARQATP